MISKSSYKLFKDCPKSLWLHFHKPEEAAEPNEIGMQNINNGNLVGELARHYFPNTVDCSVTKPSGEPIYSLQLEATETAMKGGADAMAEASFSVDGLFCAVDILKKDGDGYSIYEVKSSLDLNSSHFTDIAFQKYVLDRCGIPVRHIYLMHPDREYVLHGTLDPKRYFRVECMDSHDQVIACYNAIADEIATVADTMSREDEPQADFHKGCEKCTFFGYCGRNLPEDCIGTLSGFATKAFPFYNRGIYTVAEYVKTPEYLKKDPKVRTTIQIKKMLAHDMTPYVDRQNLKAYLDGIRYPIYYLDFETAAKIIPEFEGFRPGESYPFQYSLHIEYADGTLEHKEFLGEEENCIRALAEQLVRDIPQGAQLLAYHASTEEGIIRYLAEKLPDLAPHLLDLSGNFTDLLEAFSKGYYYDPRQKGSNSIKEVMPALCPAMADAYHRLPVVQNGGEAMTMYSKMLDMKGTSEYDTVRDGMLQYCGLDTLSMVEIMKVLKNAVK